MADERRHPSSEQTRFVSLEDLQRMLGHDRPYVPTPSDDDTKPDLTPEKCLRCKGSKVAVVERPNGTYAGPRPCPRCGGCGIDPGSPFDPGDPFAGDVPEVNP